jgi:hypothetical protein
MTELRVSGIRDLFMELRSKKNYFVHNNFFSTELLLKSYNLNLHEVQSMIPLIYVATEVQFKISSESVVF